MVSADHESPLDGAALDRLRRLGGDPLVGRMIDLFLENSARRMEAARSGLREGDLPAVAHALHSLKSSAANVGARSLGRIAEEIELRADATDAGGVAAAFAELESAFAAAHSRLTEERGSLPT